MYLQNICSATVVVTCIPPVDSVDKRQYYPPRYPCPIRCRNARLHRKASRLIRCDTATHHWSRIVNRNVPVRSQAMSASPMDPCLWSLRQYKAWSGDLCSENIADARSLLVSHYHCCVGSSRPSAGYCFESCWNRMRCAGSRANRNPHARVQADASAHHQTGRYHLRQNLHLQHRHWALKKKKSLPAWCCYECLMWWRCCCRPAFPMMQQAFRRRLARRLIKCSNASIHIYNIHTIYIF